MYTVSANTIEEPMGQGGKSSTGQINQGAITWILRIAEFL